jgi:hypothetical protein
VNEEKTTQLLERPAEPTLGDHTGLGLRLRVALRRRRLNHEIATGSDPAMSAERALRARQLCKPVSRRRAARALRSAVADVDRPHYGISAAVPVSRVAVSEWREGLLGVADVLDSADPVDPCGVARAYELVTDGGGPLYSRLSGHSLGERLWWISDGLHGGADHDA